MRSHSQAVREKAVSLWKSGKKKSEISRELKVDYDTLLGWLKRYTEEGAPGLSLRYDQCGRKARGDEDPIYQRAIELKGLNEDWGSGYMHLQLQREFADKKIVKPRQIQRWFAQAGLSAKQRLPTQKAEWTQRPLDRVQVDAKERLKTKDGKDCCYLNYTDEHTGAALDAFVFPLGQDQSGSSGNDL